MRKVGPLPAARGTWTVVVALAGEPNLIEQPQLAGRIAVYVTP